MVDQSKAVHCEILFDQKNIKQWKGQKTDGDKTGNQNVPWLWLIGVCKKRTYVTLRIYHPATAQGILYIKKTFSKQLVQQLTL